MSNRAQIGLLIGFSVCVAYFGYIVNIERTDPPEPPLAPVAGLEAHSLSFWSFSDLSGQQRHMSEWAGDLLVVNFWATWCLPCRKEIPGFMALQDRYSTDSVQFIGIAFDHLDAVQTFADELKINYPLLVGEDGVTEYMRALGNTIGALPFSAIISRDGQVMKTHQGEWPQDEIERVIRAAL